MTSGFATRFRTGTSRVPVDPVHDSRAQNAVNPGKLPLAVIQGRVDEPFPFLYSEVYQGGAGHGGRSALQGEFNPGKLPLAVIQGRVDQRPAVMSGRRIRKRMAVNEKNGKEAVTHYKVLERFQDYTYIECRLETGSLVKYL